MKNRFLASLAVSLVMSAALANAGDQDKDKTKPTTPPKQAAAVHPKPQANVSRAAAPVTHAAPAATVHAAPAATPHAAAPADQHATTQVVRPKPAVTAVRQTAVTQHQTVGHATQANGRGPDRAVVRHVSTQELHQRMNAPVGREVLIRDRDHYHQVELARYRVHPAPFRFEPRQRVVLVNLRIVPATYYHRRAVFYGAYGFVPPVYIYNFRPSYGLWCATFLAFMLDRIALAHQYEYSLMYYDHMNEPEFMEWRQEMNGLAAENADLREKLAALDARVSELEGTQRNAAYVPQEAGDVALSPQAIDKLTAAPEK